MAQNFADKFVTLGEAKSFTNQYLGRLLYPQILLWYVCRSCRRDVRIGNGHPYISKYRDYGTKFMHVSNVTLLVYDTRPVARVIVCHGI